MQDLSRHARDLFATTMAWTRQWFDPECALVWNPAGSEFGAPRSVHLVPNSARFAYGLLATGSPDDHATSVAIIDALIDLQYDLDGGPAAGTYRIVLEAPELPARPQMWTDYDPNWRQFVGTAFAMAIDDFEDRLPSPLVERMLESIRKAVEGEQDGRIPVGYTNPALLRSWLDAWTGLRFGRADLVDRGERFARAIVDEFDKWGAFDEFNSPTYYGVDLAALGLWREFATTDLFAIEGARLDAALWRSMAAFYNPVLRNFCGPYTRSYHPDATRSLSEVALWVWAAFGRDAAPLPDLSADVILHSHDMMWGPLVARLARVPEVDWPTSSTTEEPRRVRQQLDGGRTIEARITPEMMFGVESSEHDWGGWEQFMPLVAHWADGSSICALVLEQPHVVHATIRGDGIDVELPEGPFPATLAIHADRCTITDSVISTGARSLCVDIPGNVADAALALAPVSDHRWRVTVPIAPTGPRFSLTLVP